MLWSPRNSILSFINVKIETEDNCLLYFHNFLLYPAFITSLYLHNMTYQPLKPFHDPTEETHLHTLDPFENHKAPLSARKPCTTILLSTTLTLLLLSLTLNILLFLRLPTSPRSYSQPSPPLRAPSSPTNTTQPASPIDPQPTSPSKPPQISAPKTAPSQTQPGKPTPSTASSRSLAPGPRSSTSRPRARCPTTPKRAFMSLMDFTSYIAW